MIERGLTYCRSEMKELALLQKTSPQYCPICNFRVRGKNHKNGLHHQKALVEK